jgi:hypothetical protein
VNEVGAYLRSGAAVSRVAIGMPAMMPVSAHQNGYPNRKMKAGNPRKLAGEKYVAARALPLTKAPTLRPAT